MAIFKERIQDFNRNLPNHVKFLSLFFCTVRATKICYRELLRSSVVVIIDDELKSDFSSAVRMDKQSAGGLIPYYSVSREPRPISVTSAVGLAPHQLINGGSRLTSIRGSVEDLKEFILHNSCRLKEVLSRILIQNKLPLEHERLSFQSSDNDMSFVELIAFDGTQVKEDIIDLVHPNAISDLKRIAEVMFASGYDAECCEAYICIRKNALQECLRVLEVEKLVDWRSLNSKIKKWIRAVKILVTVYLASEKRLAHEIFGVFGSVGQTYFIEASKGLILQLLSFGKAVATKNHSPENIVPILYMYEGLLGLLSNIQVLFLYEVDSAVGTETREILSGLGDSVRRSLNEFKYAVGKNESSSPFAGSGVHHLTMDVMNYLQTLTNPSDTLNILLKCGGPQEGDRDDRSPLSSIGNISIEDDSEWSSSSYGLPIAWYIQSTISVLESNLESNSQLYTDVSLKHIFLMNNIDYMAQKLEESKLGVF
ncbi:hypothetical protein ACLOJK_035604 [Asimina triloba]